MERFYRVGFTWLLVFMVSIFGTIWVYGEEVEIQEENLDLKAQAAVLVDGETGRTLYAKNEDAMLAMASTTKIMTCLVALENTDPSDVVTISDYAASMPDVQLDVVSGDTFYIEDLMYALMLESHNDVAVAIAEHVGGSEEKFAEMMNHRAKKLGCTKTQFVTANGLDADGHYTTAEELARITVEALKNETFREIIQTPEHSFQNLLGTRSYHVINKNTFLNQMDGAYGVKTGFTNDAGYCFVGAAMRDDKNLISVVLGSGWPPNKEWKWMDTLKLMNYGFSNYTYQIVDVGDEALGMLLVEEGVDNKAFLKTDAAAERFLVSESDKLSVNIVKELKRKAPIKESDVVGWIYYRINGKTVKKYPIYIEHSIQQKNYIDYFKEVWHWWNLF